MVATKGILSMKADAMAETHRIARVVTKRFPPLSEITPLASADMTPVDSIPPTRIKRPVKKKMVFHSTFRRISSDLIPESSNSTTAPVIAMVADSSCRMP